MIAVKIYWNTHPSGAAVNFETVDWDDIEAPMSIYGPFETIEDAVEWMNDYPDGDDDLHDMTADDYDIPADWYVNDPVEFTNQNKDDDGDISMHYIGTPE
jgi:hypothetical protein